MRYLSADLISPDREARLSASLHLTYLLLSPNNHQRREEMIATFSAEALGRYGPNNVDQFLREALDASPSDAEEIRRHRDNHPDGPLAAERIMIDAAHEALGKTFREVFMPAGGNGLASVAAAPGIAKARQWQANAYDDLLFTGMTMATLYRIATHHNHLAKGEPSLGKTFRIVEADRGYDFIPRSESQMWEKWRTFNDVAHLAAAVFWLIESGRLGDRPLFLFDHLQVVLPMARRFQDFGLSFQATRKNDRAKAPLLDPETVWRTPGDSLANDSAMPGILAVQAQLRLASYNVKGISAR